MNADHGRSGRMLTNRESRLDMLRIERVSQSCFRSSERIIIITLLLSVSTIANAQMPGQKSARSATGAS